MQNYSLSHLASPVLLQNTVSLVAQDRTTTAALLAHLAEVDSRKLFRPAGYPSMFAWCVGKLGLSEDSAGMRLRAARHARMHPVIFRMVEDGRLSLTVVGLLAPHLTAQNADELLEAATNKTKHQVESLLAERFPKDDLPTEVKPLDDASSAQPAGAPSLALETASRPCQKPVPERVDAHKPLGRITPLSPGRVGLQTTITEGTHELLRYAQALLGHAVPSGDLDQVLHRALRLLVTELEKRKFGVGARLQPSRRRSGVTDGRYIPASVRRVVYERDGGCCTFVGEDGHRCGSTERLEYDHEVPFARGGQATPSQLRLRCQAHNQLDAERTYGTDFMRHKREQSRQRTAAAQANAKAREEARATRQAEAEAKAQAKAEAQAVKQAAAAAKAEARAKKEAEAAARRAIENDVVYLALRALKIDPERARWATSFTLDMADATEEQRIKHALRAIYPPPTRPAPEVRRVA